MFVLQVIFCLSKNFKQPFAANYSRHNTSSCDLLHEVNTMQAATIILSIVVVRNTFKGKPIGCQAKYAASFQLLRLLYTKLSAVGVILY